MAHLSNLSGSVLAAVNRDMTRNYQDVVRWSSLPGSVLATISRDMTHSYQDVVRWSNLPGSVLATISRDMTRNYQDVARWRNLPGSVLATISRDMTRNYQDVARWRNLPGSVLATISRDMTRNYQDVARWSKLPGSVLAAVSRDMTRNYRNMTRLNSLSRATDAITQPLKQNSLEMLCRNIERERCQLKQIAKTLSKENHLSRMFASPLNSMSRYPTRIQIKRNYAFTKCLPGSTSVTKEINDQLQEHLSTIGYETTRKELYQAEIAIKRKDYTGAIQHGLAALECIAREVTGNRKSTLGEIIRNNPGLFAKPLNQVINAVWGYASQHGRHLREGDEPKFHEAQFVVRICKDATIYLLHSNI